MTTQTLDTGVDLLELPPDEMERAYLEYRRACYDIVYRNAVDKGVIDVLRDPVTVAEFADRLGVVPDKVPVAELLLKALVRHGAVSFDAGAGRYAAVARPPEHTLDIGLIRLATGHDSFQELRHSENYAGIIDALTVTANPVATTFDGDHLAVWEEVLQAPFYRYSRVQAVREIGTTGPHLLDLACGPGFGLAELAASAPADGTVFGVEISPDFVASATQRNAADQRIRVTRGDVTTPLDYLQEGYFDGAMIVGAYHFLQDPTPLWHNVARLIRPGGTFCVSYVLSKMGTIDQEIMDLRFALRRPVSYQPTRQDVLDLADANGFSLNSEYGLGAWRWYSFTRL